MNLSKAAAIGALLQAAHVIILFLLTGVIASEGIAATGGGLYNPQDGLAYALRSPTLTYFHFSYFLVVFGLIPVVMMFHNRLFSSLGGLVRVATFAGLIAVILNFLGVLPGMLFRFLAQPAETHLAEAQGAYLAIILTSGAFLRGGSFVYGWWLLLNSSVALRVGVFPKALNILGIVVGLASILSFFVTQLDIFRLVGLVWLLWLAVVLLRD